ncbi:hypothetical protein OG21DRAFT_1522577 [Imleria badia]|nr:hypothetical protein OG21DRAFT_1522577 [Imleria badia]
MPLTPQGVPSVTPLPPVGRSYYAAGQMDGPQWSHGFSGAKRTDVVGQTAMRGRKYRDGHRRRCTDAGAQMGANRRNDDNADDAPLSLVAPSPLPPPLVLKTTIPMTRRRVHALITLTPSIITLALVLKPVAFVLDVATNVPLSLKGRQTATDGHSSRTHAAARSAQTHPDRQSPGDIQRHTETSADADVQMRANGWPQTGLGGDAQMQADTEGHRRTRREWQARGDIQRQSKRRWTQRGTYGRAESDRHEETYRDSHRRARTQPEDLISTNQIEATHVLPCLVPLARTTGFRISRYSPNKSSCLAVQLPTIKDLLDYSNVESWLAYYTSFLIWMQRALTIQTRM